MRTQRQAHRNGWCCRGAAVTLPGWWLSAAHDAPQLALKDPSSFGKPGPTIRHGPPLGLYLLLVLEYVNSWCVFVGVPPFIAMRQVRREPSRSRSPLADPVLLQGALSRSGTTFPAVVGFVSSRAARAKASA